MFCPAAICACAAFSAVALLLTLAGTLGVQTPMHTQLRQLVLEPLACTPDHPALLVVGKMRCRGLLKVIEVAC